MAYSELVKGRIFIGGAAEAAQAVEVGDANIVFDVRVKGHDEQPAYAYVQASILDEARAETIQQGAQQIKAAYDAGKNIYIHCGSGNGRASVMGAAVLQELGVASSLQQAIEQVKEAHPTVNIRPDMQQALQTVYK